MGIWGQNGKRPVNFAFRIDPDVYESLEAEVNEKGIPMNSLLNQICREHTSNKNFSKIGSMPMTKDMTREIFDIAKDDLLVDRARKIGSTNMVEYVATFYHDINGDTALKFLDIWFGRFLGYEHRNHSAINSFSIPHDINEKYSIYTKELVSTFVEKTMHKPVRFIQVAPRTITFSIEI